MSVRAWLFIALFLLTCPFSRVSGGDFRFRFVDNLVWVDVHSKAPGKTFHFLLDSGAGVTFVDSDCARQLGLKLGRPEIVQSVQGRTKGWKVRNLNLTVGDNPLPKTALVVDLSAVGRVLGKRIDGLIGIDFFDKRAVQLDYRAGRARIFDRYTPENGATVIPLQHRNSILCARLELNNVRSQWLRIDTGCSEALHWAGKSARRSRSSRSTTVALNPSKVSFREVAIKWGGRELGVVRAGLHRNEFFRGEDGLLGNGFFSRYRATIDARKRRLILE